MLMAADLWAQGRNAGIAMADIHALDGDVIAAEKGVRKIAVEIKTFTGASKIADLENALGQYILYRMALRRLESERELYPAVPQSVAVNPFQSREFTMQRSSSRRYVNVPASMPRRRGFTH